MSHQLILSAGEDELNLVPTSTEATWKALSSGSQAAAIEAYENFLRDEHWDGFSWMDEPAPGWSWDQVTRHLAMIDAFLAFAPAARFFST
jgi:hypothetical protein